MPAKIEIMDSSNVNVSNDDKICYSGYTETDSEEEDIVATRVPCNEGIAESFERYIVYGNYVVLSHRRWNFLDKNVSRIKPDIPFYVCETTLSMVNEGKMCFSHDYSRNFLKQYLHNDIPLRVTNEFNLIHRQVKIGMTRDGCAVITRNWDEVVMDTQLLEGDMAIFWFNEHDENGLCLNMFSGIPLYL